MAAKRFESMRRDSPSPPDQAELDRLAGEGWRLVSVVPAGDDYSAFFERPVPAGSARAVSTESADVFKSFQERMSGMLRSHSRNPQLQHLADGLTHLNEVFLGLLRDHLDDPEVQQLAAQDPELAAALEKLHRLADEET